MSFDIASPSEVPNRKGLMDADWSSFKREILNARRSSGDMVSDFAMRGIIFEKTAICRQRSISRERVEATDLSDNGSSNEVCTYERRRRKALRQSALPRRQTRR